MSVKHIDHLNLSVSDLEATIDWYARVFGFRAEERGLSHGIPYAILRSGEALLCLYEHPDREHLDSPSLQARRVHGLSHFALRIEDRDAWEATLEREKIPVGYGGIVQYPHSISWYVFDPTGYEIEVALWDEDRVRFDARESATA